MKAHAGHHGNELADQLAKEAATNNDIVEWYNKNPKSRVKSELSENSVKMWQSEWDSTTKGAITKLYFHKMADRLKLKSNVTPNFTKMETGHGNIKSYLYKYKIIESTVPLQKRRRDNRPYIVWLWTSGAGKRQKKSCSTKVRKLDRE